MLGQIGLVEPAADHDVALQDHFFHFFLYQHGQGAGLQKLDRTEFSIDVVGAACG